MSMNTKLNERVSAYLKDYPSEEITPETVINNFDIQSQNDYGGLAHAAVYRKYEEDKVLKFITYLFKTGLSPNLQGKTTGYTFLHLALYGYTKEDGSEESYTTDFILKLINIAKQYGLDVNIKDLDGDTLIHTALASEIYTGETLPLLNALGEKFDYLAKDNQGQTMKEANLAYLKIAQETGDKEWEDRLRKTNLISQSEVITSTKQEPKKEIESVPHQEKIPFSQYSLDYQQKIINELNPLMEDYISFYRNSERIQPLITDLKTTIENNSNYALPIAKQILDTYQNLRKTVEKDILEFYERSKNYNGLDEDIKTLKTLELVPAAQKLESMKKSYVEEIKKIAEEASKKLTLTHIWTLLNKIKSLPYSTKLKSLEEYLLDRNEKFTATISNIDRNERQINLAKKFLQKEIEEETIKLEEMTLDTLKDKEIAKKKENLSYCEQVKEEFVKRLDTIVEQGYELVEYHLMEEEILKNLLQDITGKQEKNSSLEKSKKLVKKND